MIKWLIGLADGDGDDVAAQGSAGSRKLLNLWAEDDDGNTALQWARKGTSTSHGECAALLAPYFPPLVQHMHVGTATKLNTL